jgi:aarF domain-containing kinase
MGLAFQGVNDSNMFASVTLQKPYMPSKAPHLSNNKVSFQDAYELQMSMKSRIKNFLANQQLFPRELIFISRNMNIVRANNKSMGSPVNRINVMARWAVRGMDRKDEAKGVRGYLRSTWRVILFESTLFAMTVSFYLVKFRDVANKLIWGTANQGGFEGMLDERMKEQVRAFGFLSFSSEIGKLTELGYLQLQQQFGIVLDESVFDA